MDHISLPEKANAIEKSLLILNQFTVRPFLYTAKELSDILGFSKPTVHRTLNILEAFHYVRRTYDGRFTIGYKAYHVGMIYANTTDILTEIRHIVDQLARQLGEQIGYAVLEGTDVVSIHESHMQDSRISYNAGAVYPINSGCYGKVLMAFSHTPDELKQLVPTLKLEPVSSGAILSHKKLLAEYLNIRRQGYGESVDEYLDGTVGLGVPVFRQDSTVHGCIALGMLKTKNYQNRRDWLLNGLMDAAHSIGEMLP